ncbi:MAG: ATP-grasp domain-containing protein [bacterium]|nr:ATP-grasp domain-containing protein [bacterium]MDT8365836.1 ATP-grasp domain-containing protein [bacterium]
MSKTSNFEIGVDTERAWFLYVGEIKAAGLSRFLVDPLSRRYGKPAECIHIVPDVLAYYPEDIFLVVGPGSDNAGPDTPGRTNSRMAPSQFAATVSADEVVKAMVDQILDIQGELILNVFESSPGLTLAADDRIKVIGPDPQIAVSMNNKLRQYEMAVHLNLPVPEGSACSGLSEALKYAEGIFSRGRKAFVSAAYSAGGSNSLVASTGEEIASRFKGVSDSLLVTEYIEHRYDPTVLGVVAGEGDVYLASVADQNIQGTRFMGSTFPTILEEDKVLKLKEITSIVGSYMGSQGYRGVFGCDYIVDEKGEIYFIEVNARKQGTTMETTLAMIHHLPGRPTLPELEMMAVLEGHLPDGLEEMNSTNGSLCWGTYNYKTVDDCMVRKYVPLSMDEEDLFKEAMAGRGGHIVLDHVGPHTHITAGGFVARVVAAGPTPDDVRKGIKAGAQRVHTSIK